MLISIYLRHKCEQARLYQKNEMFIIEWRICIIYDSLRTPGTQF